MLKIKDLNVEVENKRILKNINLEVSKGEVHVLMGPNGAGKSTLGHALMGHPRYKVEGSVELDGEEINNLNVSERARKGLFLSFQYPLEIPGVTLGSFLRSAYNSVHSEKLDVVQFNKLLNDKMKDLDLDSSFANRYLNEGFSGGEKKKAEILQMMILNPKYIILDEFDSGLDVDALKIISEGVSKMKDAGVLLITHYPKVLEYIKADKVSLLVNGGIIKSGGLELIKCIEEKGFKGRVNLEIK
tara:strand:- start:2253 stop:2984 length:732 start_codon:yes stop_codon:yes gene_type:complete